MKRLGIVLDLLDPLDNFLLKYLLSLLHLIDFLIQRLT
jgi:hypothetical protein